MKILVAFGTTEGQTRKIADHVAKSVRQLGHEAELCDCSRRLFGLDIDSFDAMILAASVHQEIHQKHVIAFVVGHLHQFEKNPSAFISVSLSAAFENGRRDACRYVDRFVRDTGWQPVHVHMAAGALRYGEYDFFKQQIIRHVVMADRDLPGAEQDCELTDWDALDDFTRGFLESAGARDE